MHFVSSGNFEKRVRKLSPKIKKALAERLRMFAENPRSPVLNDHALSGSLRHYRSINITGDYRLIYEAYNESMVLLIDIDTHHNLYGK